MVEGSPSDPPGRLSDDTPAGSVGGTKRSLWRMGVLLAAFAGALYVDMLLFPLGLGVDVSVLVPLMLLISSLFAAIAAGWAGTLLAPDNTRTRVLAVVGVCGATAAILSSLVIGLNAALHLARSDGGYGDRLMGALVLVQAIFLLVAVPLGASWATGRFRTPRPPSMGWSAGLAFVVAATAFVVSVTLLASFAGVLGLLGVLPWGLPVEFLYSPAVLVVVSVATLALGVVLGAWQRFGRGGRWMVLDVAVTLMLVGLAPLTVILTLYVAEIFGFVGA